MDGQMDGWMGAHMDISEYILTRIFVCFSISLYVSSPLSTTVKDGEWAGVC